MDVLQELKDYVQWSVEDERALKAAWEQLNNNMPQVVDAFYERIRNQPRALAILKDTRQIERLKVTLAIWLEELFCGPFNDAYYERRCRIGVKHVEVGLPSEYMFTAMSVIRRTLFALSRELLSDAEVVPTCNAIERITSIDLAIMTGTYIDTHERDKLATLASLLISHLPIMAVLLDPDGRVFAATHTVPNLLRSSRIQGLHYTELFPAPSWGQSGLLVAIAEIHSGAANVLNLRSEINLDGERRVFRMMVVPIEHKRARAMVYLEELTDALAAEARLAKIEALAQLGELSAAIAHEIRNPLAGISGAMQVIVKSFDDDDYRGPVMNEVIAQINRLNELVHDLLNYGKPEVMPLERIDLRAHAERVVELLCRLKPGVTLQVSGEGHGLANGHGMQQILINLVTNSLQAMGDEGSVEIVISNDQIRVSDNGPGIPVNIQSKMFKPFFTTRARGTGLGLAICHKSADAMAAILEYDSEIATGASFTLRFSKTKIT